MSDGHQTGQSQVVDVAPTTSDLDLQEPQPPTTASITELIQENLRLSLTALKENLPNTDLPPLEPTLLYLTGIGITHSRRNLKLPGSSSGKVQGLNFSVKSDFQGSI